MTEATPTLASAPSPFAGSEWFDPLEEAVRGQVRGFIEHLLEEELEAVLGRGRYERGTARTVAATAIGRASWSRPSARCACRCRALVCTTRRASRSGRARYCRPTSGSAAEPRR